MNYEKRNVAEKRTVRFKTPIEESLDLDNSDDNMKFLGPIKLLLFNLFYFMLMIIWKIIVIKKNLL